MDPIKLNHNTLLARLKMKSKKCWAKPGNHITPQISSNVRHAHNMNTSCLALFLREDEALDKSNSRGSFFFLPSLKLRHRALQDSSGQRPSKNRWLAFCFDNFSLMLCLLGHLLKNFVHLAPALSMRGFVPVKPKLEGSIKRRKNKRPNNDSQCPSLLTGWPQ